MEFCRRADGVVSDHALALSDISKRFGDVHALASASLTVRRGTVMCEGCHDNPRRFLLEPAAERIYQLQADGMTLPSFWDQSGQKVVNGSFLPAARYRELYGPR